MPSRKPKSKPSVRNADQRRLDEARLLIDQAFDEDDPERQVALARAALELSPDCVDAYQILGDDASSDEEAIRLYQAGVDAARRQIGESDYRRLAGHFWEFLETRPYMSARLELAERLWDVGRIDDAISHFQELLRLNPNDNQGCRQRLASALLHAGRKKELHALLAQYPDDFLADLHYTRALLAFQEQGDTEEARRYLHKAEEKNPHVPAFLTGANQLPLESPDFISPGDEREAVGYAREFLRYWRETPGAIPWVRTTLKVARPSPAPRRSPPWSRVKQALQQLPQSDAVWEVDLVPLSAGANEQAWVFLIIEASTAKPLCLESWDERPSDGELWQELISVMRQPKGDEPARPREIRLTRKTWHKNWGAKLAQVDTDCSRVEELVQIPAVVNDIRPTVGGNNRSGEEHLPANDEELASIPQQIGDVWLAAIRKLPAWIEVGDEVCRPNVLLVVDETNDLILASELNEAEPPADWLWTGIRFAIYRPGAGEPRRPGVVQVSADQDRASIGKQLESIGIRCVVIDDCEKIDELISELAERVGGTQVKSLLRSPGITSEALAGFFAAADEFYRRAPWRRIPGDTIIRIEADAFSSSVWYGVVMGQMGVQLGLALYEDLEFVRGMMQGRLSDEENARRTSALSLTFGEAFDISPVDYDAIQEHDWPVASDEAYPCVMRVNPGLALRTPLAWEIELLESCLRSIPQFLEAGIASATQHHRTSTREMAIRLSLVE